MYQIYSLNTLEVKSLADLKAIASQIGAIAADKRSKQSWIDAILDKQPKKVEQPVTEFDVVGDEVVVDGVAIAEIAQDDDLTQPWVVQINSVEIFRADTWAKCFHYVCWHYKQGTLPLPSEPSDDYLHHDEQPIQLPKIGDSYFIGNYFLRCVAIGGEYAAVWDVSNNGAVMGEIKMDWCCFWSHTISFGSFATPQEAIVNLHDCLQAYQKDMDTKILFCDIDGTLTETISGHAFKQHPKDVKVVEGANKAIAYYASLGYKVCGVSNQGGVAKGFKSLEATVEEMQFTLSLFPELEFILFCPDFEGEICVVVKRDSFEEMTNKGQNFRKPNPGMVNYGLRLLGSGYATDEVEAWMVGDRPEDGECAVNAKIKFLPADVWRNRYGYGVVEVI